MKKIFTGLVAAMLTITVITGSAAAAFSDTSGHWASANIDRAEKLGILNGYPNGTFQPEGAVTRAEYVKMLLGAMQLTPGSETANFLYNSSAYASYGKGTYDGYIYGTNPTLRDLDSNWLGKQGWAQVALDYGLIFSLDYAGQLFFPNQDITRNEAAVMNVRMMGLVYPAAHYDETDPPLTVTDAASVPDWMRGYIHQGMEAGVIGGYPDGSFGGERTITRAEAVTMVLRAMDWAEEGIDPDIKVFVSYPNKENLKEQAHLSAPAQIVDGYLYLPARNILDIAYRQYGLRDSVSYLQGVTTDQTEGQIFYFSYGHGCRYIAGTPLIISQFLNGLREPISQSPAPYRILRGEFMIPLYKENEVFGNGLGDEYSQRDSYPHWESTYDKDTKTLNIVMEWFYYRGSS